MQLADAIDAIPVVANAAERAVRFPSPVKDQRVHNLANNAIERWNGTWVTDFKGVSGKVIDVTAAPYSVVAGGAAGADQAAAIQIAIDAGGAGSYIFVPPSAVGYKLDTTLLTTYEEQIIDFRGAILYVNHSGDAIRVGLPSATTRRPKIYGGYVRHVSATNWVAGSRGLKIVNCEHGEFRLAVNGFYELVSLLGDGRGCGYNKIMLDVASNGLFGAKLYAQNVDGWVNDNTFDMGEIRYDGSVPDASLGYAIHLDRDANASSLNNNRFRGLTLQNARTTLKPKAIYLNGQQNHFNELRGEGFPATPIVLGADALLGTNYFSGMGPDFLGTVDIDFTLASNAPIVWTGRRGMEIRTDTIGSAVLRLQHRGEAAGKVIEVLRRSDAAVVGAWLTNGRMALGSGTPNRAGLSDDNMVLTLETDTTGKISVLELIGKDVGANQEVGRVSGMHLDAGTYRTLAQIRYRTAGAADAGIIDFLTQLNNAGGLVGRMRVLQSGHMVWTELTTDPTAAELTSAANAKDRLGFYMKNDKLVFAYNNAGTVTYLSLALDGATTTWVHSTTAP